MDNTPWCRKHSCFRFVCGCEPDTLKEKPDCKEYHDMNQDKDAACPYCGKAINEDF